MHADFELAAVTIGFGLLLRQVIEDLALEHVRIVLLKDCIGLWLHYFFVLAGGVVQDVPEHQAENHQKDHCAHHVLKYTN